jgi:serine/threonine protein kinase
VSSEESASALAPHSILQNRYRIVRQLGKGGMGAVYEAVDERLDATVALKETFSTDERYRKQFEQEARLLAQLNHPTLPRVSDYFTEDSRAFLVMQFIDGVDLGKILAQQPSPFPCDRVIAWADQLLDALIYLHSRNRQIIHRDIKPHNLKLTAAGHVALLDFGLAKTQAPDSSSDSFCGFTRRYAPLEQIEDRGTGPQSDLYALGATLYHLLTGVKPPDAVTRAAARANEQADPLRSANEINRTISAELAAILHRAMAEEPENRFASARDFREALRRVGRNRDRQDVQDESITSVRQSGLKGQQKGNADRLVTRDKRQQNADQDRHDESSDGSQQSGIPASSALDCLRSLENYDAPISSLRKIYLPVAMAVLCAIAVGAVYVSRQSTRLGRPMGIANEAATSQKAGAVNALLNKAGRPARHNEGTVRLETLSGPANSISAQEENSRPSRSDQTVRSIRSAPRIALPIPAFREQQVESPAWSNPPAPAKVENSATPLPQSSVAGPAFQSPVETTVLRARDGTQIVKYSDGSTRVFRPGERSARFSDPSRR